MIREATGASLSSVHEMTGEQFTAIIYALGKTKAEVARQMGVPYRTFTRWCRMNSIVPPYIARIICLAVNTDFDLLAAMEKAADVIRARPKIPSMREMAREQMAIEPQYLGAEGGPDAPSDTR